MAEALIGIYRTNVGGARGEIESAIDDYVGDAQDYKVCRGLAKILEESAVIECDFDGDTQDLRRKMFEAVAECRPIVRRADLMFGCTAEKGLAIVAGALGVSVDVLKRGMYADLRENHVVRSFDSTLQPEALIHRYNTALAQALLYRATDMVVEVHDNYRTVVRYIKLARLMHRTKTLPNGGYRIYLNGPVSLFHHSEMYGISLAKFLPALLNVKSWRMAARVNVGKAGHKIFRLDHKCGLKSHYPSEKDFDSAPEEAFFGKFSRADRKWTVHREDAILELQDSIMIPDFVFRHPDGRVAYLEIVGFWTPEYLEKKTAKLRELARDDVIVAIPEALNCSKDDFDGPVVRYKGRILLKNLLPVLEAVARPGEPPGS